MNNQIMHADDITFIVKDIMMYKLGLSENQISDAANLQDDLGIDSLDIVEFQMELEKRLGITISDEEGEQLKTFGQIVQFIKVKSL